MMMTSGTYDHTNKLLQQTGHFGPNRHQTSLGQPIADKSDVVMLLRLKIEANFRDLRPAFRALDGDSSGDLTRQECEAGLVRFNIPRHFIDALMRKLDTNYDGLISFAEFAAALNPAHGNAFGTHGQNDRFVTNRHVVVPNSAGGQVWTNDNLQLHGAGGEYRPDSQLMALPRVAASSVATSAQLRDYSSQMSTMIYNKHTQLRNAFREIDANKDGRLSEAEFKRAVRMYNMPIPERHAEQMFRELCDRDGDGQLDYEEFALALKRKDALGN